MATHSSVLAWRTPCTDWQATVHRVTNSLDKTSNVSRRMRMRGVLISELPSQVNSNMDSGRRPEREPCH